MGKRANPEKFCTGRPNQAAPSGVSDELSSEERNRWRELDETVKRGIREIRKLGAALLEIREKRLYREDFATWKDYCEVVLEMSKPQANRMITGAKVLADLAPIGAKILPKGESQLRELARLPTSELRLSAWKTILRRGDESITAKVVREEVEKIRSDNGSSDPGRKLYTDAVSDAVPEKGTIGQESGRPPASTVKAGKIEADYIQPLWFEETDKEIFELADSTKSDPAPFSSNESLIAASQVSGKLRAMAENNSRAKEHQVTDEAMAGRQELLIRYVVTTNQIAGKSHDSATKEDIFWAVEEFHHLMAYLRPVSDPEGRSNAAGEEENK